MLQILRNIGYVCSEIWRNIGIAQKVSMILIGVAAIAAISAIVYVGTRPNWHAAYTDLDRKTASEIYELAEGENIPVKLKDGGSTVAVPYRHVNKLRTRAANQGIKVEDKGVGLELFGERKFGMTKKQQQIGFQRAMQGELARMIRGMRGVEDAKVLLSIPERDPFRKEEEQEAEASVFITKRRGYNLGNDTVTTVRQMVAGGIDKLKAENVTVTDDSGRLLARGGGGINQSVGNLTTQMEITNQIESKIERKAESIMRPIVGMGNVKANASVNVSLDTGQKTIESYHEDQSAVKEERQVKETTQQARASEGKAAGSSSNVVSIDQPEGGQGNGEKSSSSEVVTETQYLVPKTVEVINERGIKVTDLSIAVAISTPAEGETRSEEELNNFKKLIASAVSGSVASLKNPMDTVTIVEKPFVRQKPAPETDKTAFTPEKLMNYASTLGYERIASMFVGFMLLFFLYRGYKKTFANHRVSQEELPRMEWEQNVQSVEGRQSEVVSAAESSGAKEVPQEDTGFETIKQKASENPELVAGAIERWVANEVGTQRKSK